MKTIKLTQGYEAIVDDEDYEKLNQRKWHVLIAPKRDVKYAGHSFWDTKAKRTDHIRMHHMIIGKQNGFDVDHINRNGLDNRRANLRHCTQSQNIANTTPRKNNKSGFKGVTETPNGTWHAVIRENGKPNYIGNFRHSKEAAKAYDKEALRIYGEFAYLNFPKEQPDD